MAAATKGKQRDEGQPQPGLQFDFSISKPVGTDGPWLRSIVLRAFLDKKCVGKCDAKLIIEAEYTSATRHFFSAMDDQSNTMGDLAQLLLWSENRWVFEGPWQGMKEYGARMPVREQLDEETRRTKGQPTLRRYYHPVLFKSRPNKMDHLPIPIKTQWVVLFTAIDVAKVYRGNGIDRAMVTMLLGRTRSYANKVHRPLLAAVEPGCVQFKRLAISDPGLFEEKYGSMRRHWPEVQSLTARQEKFWLEMGFQKFEKPEENQDLSNFFFWSGLFDLPEYKEIDLKPRDLGKQIAGSELLDGSMTFPQRKLPGPVYRQKSVREPVPEKSGELDQDVDMDSSESQGINLPDQDTGAASSSSLDQSVPTTEQRPENTGELDQDMDIDSNDSEGINSPGQDTGATGFESQHVISGHSVPATGKVRETPEKRVRIDDDSVTAPEERPEKRVRLHPSNYDMPIHWNNYLNQNTGFIQGSDLNQGSDEANDDDLFDVINWPDYD